VVKIFAFLEPGRDHFFFKGPKFIGKKIDIIS